MKKIIAYTLIATGEMILLPLLFLSSFILRFKTKKIDVGLGPLPMINNIYHKEALEKQNFSAETFVNTCYFITDQFDIRIDKHLKGYFRLLIPFILFYLCIWRYKIVYIYFNGGPLSQSFILKKFEPFLYKINNLKTVIIPFGGDVQDILRSDNLLFRNALTKDYPLFKNQRKKIISDVDLWTKHGDFIISGCDWVYYLFHWDLLMLAHFSINTDKILPRTVKINKSKTVKILHAPNHKYIKGSDFFIQAVKELKDEGLDVEIELIQRLPNPALLEKMKEADIIADQLVIGWYAMTALEGMSLEKPVLCHLDPKLIELYLHEGLISNEEEIPLVNCNFKNVKEKIKWLVLNPAERIKIGQKGRKFVIKHHSLDKIGKTFADINRTLLS